MAQGRAVTDESTEKLLKGLRLGMTRRAASAFAGFSRTTLYRMIDKDDGTLVTAIEKAEGEAEAEFSAIVAREAAVPKNWTAAAWWLERRHPSDYARRERVEMSGPDGGPIDHRDVGALPDHEKQALAEAIRDHLRSQDAESAEGAATGDREA